MLDIKKIKENPDAVKAGLKAKEVDCDAVIDRILELDEQRRTLITSSEGKTAQKKKLSKEFGKYMGMIKKAEKTGEDASAARAALADYDACLAKVLDALAPSPEPEPDVDAEEEGAACI